MDLQQLATIGSRLPISVCRCLAVTIAIGLLSACNQSGISASQNSQPDNASPAVAITSPTTLPGFSTGSGTVNLAGTSSDNVGVTQVSWFNNRGGSGIAAGTTAWSINNVSLLTGQNVVTVTARDAAGNTANDVLTVTLTTSGSPVLSGTVDSSLTRRNGGNAVYVYANGQTPDDLGSGSPPLAVIPVEQIPGTCAWSYQTGTLSAGNYTLAFTSQSASDNPGTNDNIGFVGTASVSVTNGATTLHNFVPARIIPVGPTRALLVPSQAAGLVAPGDVVEIDAGTYSGDVATWSVSNVTLRGVGGRAHLAAAGNNAQGKGTWVISGSGVRVENMEFSGSAVPDRNGAGIRAEGNDLTVCNSYFHHNENGILGGGGDMLIEYSEFAYNGGCVSGYGCSHNMYISNAQRFTLRYSYSHHAQIGHQVKSRAAENYILYNRLMDESAGTASYEIDLPDCGASTIVGNLIQKGLNADNSTFVAYGAEGCSNGNQVLSVVNNTFVNDRASGTFVSVRAGTTATLQNNLVVGSGTLLSGPGTLLTNLSTATPGFLNQAGYDYRLTSTSSARNGGSVPAAGLTPDRHYVHPTSQAERPSDVQLDIGAYEYTP